MVERLGEGEYKVVDIQVEKTHNFFADGVLSHNCLILDDYLRDWQDASSKTIREKHWDWYRSVFRTRLQKDGGIAITVTRWNEDDIVGRLLANEGDQWTVINLPAIQDKEPTDEDARAMGEALWPDEYPTKALHEIRDTIGERIFEALYQGNPTPQEGEVIKRAWWQYYTKADLPPSFEQTIISADLTFNDKEKSDFCVFQVWGKLGSSKYLLHQVRERMAFVAQVAALRQLHAKYNPNATYIEDAANGAALVAVVRRSLSGVIAVRPDRSKMARLEAVSPQIQAGNVFLPSDAPWLGPFIEEFAIFPNGKNDDMVDSLSLGLGRLGQAYDYDLDLGDNLEMTRASIWR